MKILHFLWSLENGGAENLVVDLANNHCRGHEVTLYVANDLLDASMRARLDSRVHFKHLRRPGGSRNPFWLARMILAIRALRPDIVHVHASNFATIGRFVAAPIVLTAHSNGVRFSPHAHHFAMICCISGAVQDDIRQRHPELRTRLIENGIHTSAIATRSGNKPASRPLRAVQVSRLRHAFKGQDLLIQAAAIVNRECSEPRIVVDFIGDGPSRGHLEALICETGAGSFCRILGPRSRAEVYALLQDYDVLVQPSRDEGFGLTVAEGMAAGLAVVVSDLEGPMQVIEHGKFGSCFSSGDADVLACALEATINEFGTEAAQSRRAAARTHVLTRYDLSVTASNYLRLYQELAPS